MNKTLEKIILDWIGENRDSRYSDADGVNSALSDLRARVPELVDIIRSKQEEILRNYITLKNIGKIGELDAYKGTVEWSKIPNCMKPNNGTHFTGWDIFDITGAVIFGSASIAILILAFKVIKHTII